MSKDTSSITGIRTNTLTTQHQNSVRCTKTARSQKGHNFIQLLKHKKVTHDKHTKMLLARIRLSAKLHRVTCTSCDAYPTLKLLSNIFCIYVKIASGIEYINFGFTRTYRCMVALCTFPSPVKTSKWRLGIRTHDLFNSRAVSHQHHFLLSAPQWNWAQDYRVVV